MTLNCSYDADASVNKLLLLTYLESFVVNLLSIVCYIVICVCCILETIKTHQSVMNSHRTVLFVLF